MYCGRSHVLRGEEGGQQTAKPTLGLFHLPHMMHFLNLVSSFYFNHLASMKIVESGGTLPFLQLQHLVMCFTV